MLWLIYGIPGSGKTLFALADYIIPAAREKRRVYTNITGLSPAGISGVAKCPPTNVCIEKVETVADVLSAFDTDEANHSIFVLDEMRSMLQGDKKVEVWLTQRINIMRKKDIDFVLIAQVPGYFDEELRELATGCSLFKRRYQWGSATTTTEYRFDCGTPKIVSQKPVAQSSFVRKLDPIYFTCYQSYIDNQIQGGNEDKKAMQRVTKVWATDNAKKLYVCLAIPLVLMIATFWFLGKITDMGKNMAQGSKTQSVEETPDESTKHVSSPASVETEGGSVCYSKVYCVDGWCRTDKGNYPESSYDTLGGYFVRADGILPRCNGVEL